LKLMVNKRIEKLLVVDDQMRLRGLITVKDLEKVKDFPNAARDQRGRLLCAAAVGPGRDLEARSHALIDAGVDVLVVDTAHGHSKGVLDALRSLRRWFPDACLAGGNIATAEAATALVDAGADVVKAGIGPGSICTTRIVAGVGVPQVTAVMDVSAAARAKGATTIADGGIKYSGDCVKALAAGADAVMVGSLFAGTAEAPGEVVLFQGRSFKVYRGMGSMGAMESGQGSRERYGQADVKEASKLVPEGIEGRVPFRGPISSQLFQLVGGVRSGMGYLGAPDLQTLRSRARFVRVTAMGLREAHVHDVIITKEAPNYRAD
jgi:IMP dehydrogenase